MTENAPHVVLGGEGLLALDLFAAQLGSSPEVDLSSDRGRMPRRWRDAVRSAPSPSPVGVLIDPMGAEWAKAVDELRLENERTGIVVVTARPDYAKTRYWRHYVRDDLPRANALLALTSTDDDLIEAIQDARKRPGQQSPFWPDGPRHPFAHSKTDEGKLATEARTRAKGELHRTLALLASGREPRVIANELNVQRETIGERLGVLREILGAKNDVQLGHLATRLGLLDDLGAWDVE